MRTTVQERRNYVVLGVTCFVAGMLLSWALCI